MAWLQAREAAATARDCLWRNFVFAYYTSTLVCSIYTSTLEVSILVKSLYYVLNPDWQLCFHRRINTSSTLHKENGGHVDMGKEKRQVKLKQLPTTTRMLGFKIPSRLVINNASF